MSSKSGTLIDQKFSIQERQGMKGLFTNRKIFEGETIIQIVGETLEHPTRTSVQIKSGKHIDVKAPAMYINHSCSGNIELKALEFVALKDIEPGEEITFNYNENEDELAHPFKCRKCNQQVKGKNFVAKYPCLAKN